MSFKLYIYLLRYSTATRKQTLLECIRNQTAEKNSESFPVEARQNFVKSNINIVKERIEPVLAFPEPSWTTFLLQQHA